MSTEPRYGICHDFGLLDDRVIVSLPDAEHIHVHRHPDGSITAVAMEWTRIDLEDPSNTRWRDVEGGAA